MTLAIDGGKPAVQGPLLPYNSIGLAEEDKAASIVAGWRLSGYLGGGRRGGYWVCKLEDEWAARFGVKHAIACNSATSGLLAAAHAIELGAGARFLCSPLTMSATAAAPAMTGAQPLFIDVHRSTFCLDPAMSVIAVEPTEAVFLTHLFGLAQNEVEWKGWCDAHGCKLIVDAAQAPFADDHGVLAGTAGDVGVYSLNVHKHLQCGEGGIVVTNDDDLASRVRLFINHGELADGPLGLNLRMTEVAAGIALIQLRRADALIANRVKQAEDLIRAIVARPLMGLQIPATMYDRPATKHVYYTVPFTCGAHIDRAWLIEALRAEGVPLTEGYGPPLHRLPAFKGCGWPCPVADELHDRTLFYFENCAYSPTPTQINQIGEAFAKVIEHADRRTLHRT